MSQYNDNLPNEDADIHPWMPTSLHQGCHTSPLGRLCGVLGVSIHDREQVYQMMRAQELLPPLRFDELGRSI
jgi:hypothetical protein